MHRLCPGHSLLHPHARLRKPAFPTNCSPPLCGATPCRPPGAHTCWSATALGHLPISCGTYRCKVRLLAQRAGFSDWLSLCLFFAALCIWLASRSQPVRAVPPDVLPHITTLCARAHLCIPHINRYACWVTPWACHGQPRTKGTHPLACCCSLVLPLPVHSTDPIWRNGTPPRPQPRHGCAVCSVLLRCLAQQCRGIW